MYTVLLPVDADESRAQSQAAMVADLPQAAADVQVYLLHVFDDRQRAENTLPTQVPSGQAAMDRLQRADIPVELRSESGSPAATILRVADDVDADLIVLGGRKRSPLGSALFGSVSQQVTLDAKRPVVVTGDQIARAQPSHRCRSCGEEYFTDPDAEITNCRRCGGNKVHRVDGETVRAP